MGFIAEFETNWADEIDIYGLRYFESMEDYLAEFCWCAAFDIFDIDISSMLDFMGLEYDPDKSYGDYEDQMIDFFSLHLDKVKKQYFEIFHEDPFEKVTDPHIGLIYVGLLIKKEEDANYNPEEEMISFCIGTNEDTEMTAMDYLGYVFPDILAEGEMAAKLTHGFRFVKGPFYM